ncbi:MAG: hypothetical protein P1U89_14300 [Verrucomicrobiales bacterium]|nr:hypothetical protein [Verrucomicrobiales bacterium]
MTQQDPLFLIDGIGPFFKDYKKVRVNWSKIPWRRIQKLNPEQRQTYFDTVYADLETFCDSTKEIGYNAVSLDDLPHLADHAFYEPEVRSEIAQNRTDFSRCFQIIKDTGMKVFLTMDVMVFTDGLLEQLGSSESKINQFLCELFDGFFEDTPEIDGVIIRIGESDGQDVKEAFRSKLVLKNPREVNRFLNAILPVFEKHGRTCIFRTWTVGAHRIGDLIWHQGTLNRAVDGINSPSLILSMKYGDSDFLRYLDLNPNFFSTDIPTLIELQTRREYEGCGEYPSFVGGDYGQFALELKEAPNLAGINVWCQTGGWTPFRRLAFVDDNAIWTEINTFVTLRIFKHGESWEEALVKHPKCQDPASWIELFRLSEEVVKDLLYLPDFARQKLYFRRVRIPTLIGVYWHNIFIAHAVRRMMKHFVKDGEAAIRSGHAALQKIRQMKTLAAKCNLPVDDIEFMEDTFTILALAREYFFRPFTPEIEAKLKSAKKAYKRKYPRGTRFRYALKIDLSPFILNARHLSWFTKYLLRDKPGYRFIDQILGLRLLSYCYLLLKKTRPTMIPKFARKSAMGIDAIFK